MMHSPSRRAFVAALLPTAAALQSACGYNLSGRGNFLPSYIRVIGIPLFTNHTSVYDIEQLFTTRVRSEFLGRGRYQVIPLTDGADAILSGTVAGLSLDRAASTRTTRPPAISFACNSRSSSSDVKANKLIWENPSLEILDEYDLTTGTGALDASAFLGQNRAAADRIADTVARRTVSSILEAF